MLSKYLQLAHSQPSDTDNFLHATFLDTQKNCHCQFKTTSSSNNALLEQEYQTSQIIAANCNTAQDFATYLNKYYDDKRHVYLEMPSHYQDLQTYLLKTNGTLPFVHLAKQLCHMLTRLHYTCHVLHLGVNLHNIYYDGEHVCLGNFLHSRVVSTIKPFVENYTDITCMDNVACKSRTYAIIA